MDLISPAQSSIGCIPLVALSVSIPLLGLTLFFYILLKRLQPLFKATPDDRFNRYKDRFINAFRFWFLQYKQTRYRIAGITHIIIFAAFLILSLRSFTLIMLGVINGFTLPGLGGNLGHLYNGLKDIFATIVLVVCLAAMIRRGLFRPRRYEVQPQNRRGHGGEAYLVLILIAALMVCDMVFEGTLISAHLKKGADHLYLIPVTGSWLAGLKGNPFIVAVNKNPKAPIFQVADVGIINDILDFIPNLKESIKQIK